MVKDLYKLYDENKDSWIIQRGSGKAYSSGGDLLETLQNKPNMLENIRYLYNFNLKTLKHENNISIWDGILMGFGVGTAIHHKYRIATDTTIFAMPECAIGIIPDHGSNHFIPKYAGMEIGRYIALTGARLNGAD